MRANKLAADLMKSLITSIAAASCVLIAAELLAQDLAPPRLTSPPPEQAAPATPRSDAASPQPPQSPPEATPTAADGTQAPQREKARRRLSSPRSDALHQKPVRAVERRNPFIRRLPAPQRNGARASRPTFDLSEGNWVTAATIRSLENRWEAAVKNHDVRALGELLSDNFEGTTASGNEASKERMLTLLRRDKNVYKSARAHSMNVKALGSATAVVTGVSSESGVTSEGKKFRVARSFTDTWKLRDGRWHCVASRITDNRHR